MDTLIKKVNDAVDFHGVIMVCMDGSVHVLEKRDSDILWARFVAYIELSDTEISLIDKMFNKEIFIDTSTNMTIG